MNGKKYAFLRMELTKYCSPIAGNRKFYGVEWDTVARKNTGEQNSEETIVTAIKTPFLSMLLLLSQCLRDLPETPVWENCVIKWVASMGGSLHWFRAFQFICLKDYREMEAFIYYKVIRNKNKSITLFYVMSRATRTEFAFFLVSTVNFPPVPSWLHPSRYNTFQAPESHFSKSVTQSAIIFRPDVNNILFLCLWSAYQRNLNPTFSIST